MSWQTMLPIEYSNFVAGVARSQSARTLALCRPRYFVEKPPCHEAHQDGGHTA
jgi:hypothetical protein